MYPGVIIEYDDQSLIQQIEPAVTTVQNVPLFAAVFTSDKGTEEWTRISGRQFFNMYGENISFNRHGQPLLQAAMSIQAGAELLCKRLVADDATLAIAAVVAKIGTKDVTTQKVDADGNALYADADGNETTEATAADGTDNTPITVVEAVPSITYSFKILTDTDSYYSADDAYAAIKETLGEGEHLLYVIADNGRGASKKRIKIVPNYKLSKNADYAIYTLSVIENATEVESISFSFNPNIVSNGVNISLKSMVNANSTQISCAANDADLDIFVDAVAKALNIDPTVAYTYDLLFGCTPKGAAIAGLTVDGSVLQNSAGQPLQGGSNGSFGDYPVKNEAEWSKQAVAAFDGSFDSVIFNVDQYKIHAVIDANYPAKVKRAIETLATFREDFMYFRDMGLGKTSIDLIDKATLDETKNMFCASYCQSYDVYDPYTKRQIPVTIGYDLAQLLVKHLDNGAILPTAGMKHGMVINNAIYGTLSFAPTICPDPEGNQKEQLEDMRVNFASYIDNRLVIETLYTSQEKHTQWSYVNNVMGVQEVIRAIRTRCPSIRYNFIDGTDLEKYKLDVEDIIAPYKSNFKTLELVYATDSTYAANKIFYAVLKVVYKDFVQTEWFKVTAIQDPTAVAGSTN